MTLINLDQNDIAIFRSNVDIDRVKFLKRHIDAFLTFYDKHGKQFWFRYLVSFREQFYKHHFQDIDHVDKSSLCKHEITYICDDAFMILHKEFIECSKTKKVKSALLDVMTVVLYYLHFSSSYPPNLKNDPFHRPETKGAFDRFFGFSEKYGTPALKKVLDLFIPAVYACFVGNIYTLLHRWMSFNKNNPKVDTKIFKWIPPPNWTTDGFLPNTYEKFISCYYGDRLEQELGLEGNTKILIYLGRPISSKTVFDSTWQHCACENTNYLNHLFKVDETGSLSIRRCNHKPEDFDNVDGISLDHVGGICVNLMEKFSDSISCLICREEAKKTILFKLAEKQFQEEQEIEEEVELKSQAKTKKRKKKKKKSKLELPKEPGVQTDTESYHKNALHDKIIEKTSVTTNKLNEEEMGAHGFEIAPSFVSDFVIRKCKEQGFTGNTKLIKENIDKVEELILKKGYLDEEHLSLMLNTGAMLKGQQLQSKTVPSNNQGKVPTVESFRCCFNCQKLKNGEVKLKKCALCVKKNLTPIRYYCSKDCQAQDWLKFHKDYHEKLSMTDTVD